MSKFSNKLKNSVFGPFSQFWGQKKFSQKIPLSHTTSHGILAPCQNLEKINDTIPRKRPDRRNDGRTDRPYFIRPFQLPLGLQKGTKEGNFSR